MAVSKGEGSGATLNTICCDREPTARPSRALPSLSKGASLLRTSGGFWPLGGFFSLSQRGESGSRSEESGASQDSSPPGISKTGRCEELSSISSRASNVARAASISSEVKRGRRQLEEEGLWTAMGILSVSRIEETSMIPFLWRACKRQRVPAGAIKKAPLSGSAEGGASGRERPITCWRACRSRPPRRRWC